MISQSLELEHPLCPAGQRGARDPQVPKKCHQLTG
jgi:hypothetical protein